MELRKIKAYLLFSVVPITQLVGLVPLLSTAYGLSLGRTGWIFFSLRISLLVGSFWAKSISKWSRPSKILIAAEAISSLLALTCLYFVSSQNILGISMYFVIRCLIVGITNNTRMSLLKTLKDQDIASRAAVFSTTIVQASYVISGILFIFSTFNKDIFFYAIMVNVLTPLISIGFIRSIFPLDNQTETLNLVEKVPMVDFAFLLERSKRSLFIISILVGLIFGGIDILCLNYGKEIYQGDYGYGIITIIYSVCFYVGYQLYDYFKTPFLNSLRNSVLALLLIFICSLFGRHQYVDTLILIIIFIIYGSLYASIEQEWYLNIDSGKSSSQFFLKDLIIAITYASGEILYSQLHEVDRLLRIGFLSLLILIVVSRRIIQKE